MDSAQFSCFLEPLQKYIKSKLRKDEEVFWMGQPILIINNIFILKAICAYIAAFVLASIPTSLIFYGIKYHDTRLAIGLIAALFCYYFSYALFLWPKVQIEEQRGTVYLVTSKRAVVIMPANPFHLTSVPPDELKKYSVSENSDGSGDILLKEVFVRNQHGGYELRDAFFNIKEVKIAEMAIKRLLGTKCSTENIS